VEHLTFAGTAFNISPEVFQKKFCTRPKQMQAMVRWCGPRCLGGGISCCGIAKGLGMMVLRALVTALEIYTVGVQANSAPLHESYWHMYMWEHYKLIRADLIELDAQAAEKSASGLATPCEQFVSKFPIVCRVSMHG
jgi:hypothetical protein